MSATDHSHRKEPLPCPDEPESIQLEDVLITEELSRRSPRQPNLQAENQALRSLARQLAHEPARMLQSLVDLAVELCDAGTAGVSLVETLPNGEVGFRWVAMAGTLAAYLGGCLSRDCCPCGVCLERGVPLLFAYPARYFTEFQQVNTPVIESLVLPLIAEGQTLGTIWIMTHDEQRQFDAEDMRLMMGLADFTAATLLHGQQQANQLRVANTALAVEVSRRELAEDQVLAVIENLPGGAAFVVDRDLRYQLAAGEALAIAGLKPGDLVGKTIFEVLPPELTTCYEPMYRKALAGEPFKHEHQAHDRWYVSRGTPLRTENGNVYAVLVVSYDISERKCAEASIEADLRDTRLLHNLAIQYPSTGQGQALYQSILDAAIALMHADMGSLQILDPAHDELHLQAWRGFHPAAAAFWQSVRIDGGSSCSVALRQGGRVIVSDIEACDFASGTADLKFFRLCGIKAVQSTPLRSHSGQFIGMFSTHWSKPHQPSERELRFLDILARQAADLIEHQQAEAAMHASEAKYRSLFNSIDEGFLMAEVMYDESGQPVDALYLEGNPAASRLTGVLDYTRQRLNDLSPHFESYWLETYDRVLKTGVSERAEQYAAPLDRWYDFYVFPVSATTNVGDDRRVAVIFQDITARKQAEATIAADLRDTQLLQELSVRLTSEEDVQVLYNEIMAAAIALTQADAGSFQCFDFNTNELKLLAAQGLNQNIIDHFDRVRASSQTSCGRALAYGERAFVDFDVPEDLDGSLKMHLDAGFLSAQSTPLISRSRRFIGMFSTHWRRHHRPSDRELRFLDLLARQAADLIEQRQAELERRQLLQREQAAREEAERANRIKDEFLAILSHELRSPLNPILGWSKLLQSKSFDSAVLQQGLSTIERNAKLQTQLIDDLLDISRILRGKLSLEETTVNLATAVEAAMEVVKTAAQAKSITLQFNRVKACQVRGDEGRLQQVVWNLLSNAIKFTPNGGRVNVRLDAFYNQAQITVTDTGQGISPDFMPYLFQSFRQEDSSITRQYGGLGLGLAIVKYLVDAHGGSITATSPGGGQGASFTVQLPLLQEESAPPLPAASAEIDLTGLKVLAVDDSEDTRELLTAVLMAYGAETRVVASGHEVLAHLAPFAPDLLICDIGMPDMDGYTLLQQIRALPDTEGGNIPAIAVTAFAHEEDRQKALAYGFQQHLAKPIEPKDLINTIARLVVR